MTKVDNVLMDLDEGLSKSAQKHEAGSHFEEGGCGAFAIALQRILRNLGIRSSLRGMTGFRHVFVQVGNVLVDHQGVVASEEYHTKASTIKGVTETAIRGCGAEQFQSDVAWADEIIRGALDG